MNTDISDQQVYDALCQAWSTFSQGMTGSEFVRITSNNVFSGTGYNASGITVTTCIKERMRPDGKSVLPSTPINPTLLTAGSFFALTTVSINGEGEFSIQAPHKEPENYVHLQKGRDCKIQLPPLPCVIKDFGALGSALFLRFNSQEEAKDMINKVRQV